jgi:hypothetical protein
MHGIEMEVTEYAETQVIGKTVVNNKTRDAVVGEMTSRMLAPRRGGRHPAEPDGRDRPGPAAV